MSKGEVYHYKVYYIFVLIVQTGLLSIIATIVWSNFWKIEPSIFYGPFRSRVVITKEIHQIFNQLLDTTCVHCKEKDSYFQSTISFQLQFTCTFFNQTLQCTHSFQQHTASTSIIISSIDSSFGNWDFKRDNFKVEHTVRMLTSHYSLVLCSFPIQQFVRIMWSTKLDQMISKLLKQDSH